MRRFLTDGVVTYYEGVTVQMCNVALGVLMQTALSRMKAYIHTTNSSEGAEKTHIKREKAGAAIIC